MRSSSQRCRRTRPPSCWSSTGRRARPPCRPRRNPTREAPCPREAAASAGEAAAARTSLDEAADRDTEAAAAEASRTGATTGEVRPRLESAPSVETERKKNQGARVTFGSSHRSGATLWLLPPTTQLPTAPEHQRRLPWTWQLQPRTHAHPGGVAEGRPHEGEYGSPRGAHEQRRPRASREHEPRRRRRRPDEPWRTQGTPWPRRCHTPRPARSHHQHTLTRLNLCLCSTIREAATGATLATRMATSTTETAATLAATGTAWTRPKRSTRAGSKGSVFHLITSTFISLASPVFIQSDISQTI